MQQHSRTYFARRPSPLQPWGLVNRSEFNFFQNMVMLHIKFKGITKMQQHGS